MAEWGCIRLPPHILNYELDGSDQFHVRGTLTAVPIQEEDKWTQSLPGCFGEKFLTAEESKAKILD